MALHLIVKYLYTYNLHTKQKYSTGGLDHTVLRPYARGVLAGLGYVTSLGSSICHHNAFPKLGEIEDYAVDLQDVSALKLTIKPDIGG